MLGVYPPGAVAIASLEGRVHVLSVHEGAAGAAAFSGGLHIAAYVQSSVLGTDTEVGPRNDGPRARETASGRDTPRGEAVAHVLAAEGGASFQHVHAKMAAVQVRVAETARADDAAPMTRQQWEMSPTLAGGGWGVVGTGE